jgi:hypothetical protein
MYDVNLLFVKAKHRCSDMGRTFRKVSPKFHYTLVQHAKIRNSVRLIGNKQKYLCENKVFQPQNPKRTPFNPYYPNTTKKNRRPSFDNLRRSLVLEAGLEPAQAFLPKGF